MLIRLGARGCRARVDQAIISDAEHDFDPDPDFDCDSDLDEDANGPLPRVAGDLLTACLTASIGARPVLPVSAIVPTKPSSTETY